MLFCLFAACCSHAAALPAGLENTLKRPKHIASYALEKGQLTIFSTAEKLERQDMEILVKQICLTMTTLTTKKHDREFDNNFDNMLVVYNWRPTDISRITLRSIALEAYQFDGGGTSCDLALNSLTGKEFDRIIQSHIHPITLSRQTTGNHPSPTVKK